MYWPNGVPRVYAVNGPDIADISFDGERQHTLPSPDPRSSIEESNDVTSGQETIVGESQEPTPESIAEKDIPKWENEAINGLCVSRSGHMFATLTESSISLWQTRVCFSMTW
jgi:hypothetical protein